MNGANADPSVNIIKIPNKSKNATIGNIHHFLLIFKNSKYSFSIDSFDISFYLSIFAVKPVCERFSQSSVSFNGQMIEKQIFSSCHHITGNN